MQPSLPEAKDHEAALSEGPIRVLAMRALSALLLAPFVLLAVYFGPPASDALLLLAGGVMAWEWARFCNGGRPFGLAEAMLVAGVLLAILAGALGGPESGAWAMALGLLAVLLAARRSQPGTAGSLWYAFGLLYVAVPILAFQWLRGSGQGRADLVFWLLAVVWATDLGAYGAGRSLKGPKLLPRVSPSKTWSGLAGGMLAAAAAGSLVGGGLGLPSPGGMAALAAFLALLAQAGDFLESGVKRHFGRKDSSGLIPGHGGLLDRVDGLIAATLALALLVWLEEVPL